MSFCIAMTTSKQQDKTIFGIVVTLAQTTYNVDNLTWCSIIAHINVVTNHKITKVVVSIVTLVVEMHLFSEVTMNIYNHVNIFP